MTAKGREALENPFRDKAGRLAELSGARRVEVLPVGTEIFHDFFLEKIPDPDDIFCRVVDVKVIDLWNAHGFYPALFVIGGKSLNRSKVIPEP